MGAAALLVGKHPADLVDQRLLLRVGHQPHEVVGVGDRDLALAGADAANLVGVAAHRLAGEVVDHPLRSEEHTSELQSLMRISYAVFCLKKKTRTTRLTN